MYLLQELPLNNLLFDLKYNFTNIVKARLIRIETVLNSKNKGRYKVTCQENKSTEGIARPI
jgi:hypothetical protein